MSSALMKQVFGLTINTAEHKLVLLALADQASDDGFIYTENRRKGFISYLAFNYGFSEFELTTHIENLVKYNMLYDFWNGYSLDIGLLKKEFPPKQSKECSWVVTPDC